MAANFRPHGLVQNPGQEVLWRRVVSERYEAHARGFTNLMLTGLASEQKDKGRGDFYASECTPVNDDTRTEADNVFWFYESGTWEFLILCIGEGKMDKSQGKDGEFKWSIPAAKQAEEEVLVYCKEYMLHKD